MKRLSRLTTVFAVVLAALTLCVSADEVYSSKNDPLVSLSYVNDVLAPEIVSQVMEKIEAEYVKLSDISIASAGSYTNLTLKKGQTLMASSVCELILLNGSAVTVVTSASNLEAGAGLSDLTDGSVLRNGSPLPANHYLVVPKGDGRGLTVVSEKVDLLVRGEYNITG